MSKSKEKESALEAAFRHMQERGSTIERPSDDHITTLELAEMSGRSETHIRKYFKDLIKEGKAERVKSGSKFYYKEL